MMYTILPVKKEEVQIGDIILCKDGIIRTVCRNNLTQGFMGICIFGDSYRLGTEMVNKITNLKF